MRDSSVVVALPYVNWTVLMALAFGSVSLASVLRQATDVTRGFVGFTTALAGALALLALALDGSLPDPAQLVIRAMPQLDGLRRVALATFAGLAFGSVILALRGRDIRWPGLACMAVGAGILGLAALGWAGTGLASVPLFVQMLVLSAVSGGALGAVILGHWYLVTPKLSERPLILATRLLTAALVLQLLLFATWQIVGGAWGSSFSALTGPVAVFVWLRLSVGIVFPLVLSYLAYRTALTRSMESATGLLYLNLAAVLASTIVACALYYTGALLV
jgi:hypothetical protein